jgi:hypothetical protein
MININMDTSSLVAMANDLEHLDLRPAISRALNRAGDQATTAIDLPEQPQARLIDLSPR